MKKVTIHDIARKAGVSIGAVSRALQNDSRISEKTRKKVHAVVKRMGYLPNSIGKGLRTGKSYLIGYLVSRVEDSFYNEILQGIGQTVCEKGYGLITGITENNPESEKAQIRLFLSKNIDGLIVSNYHPKTAPLLKKLHKEGMPLVLCDADPLFPIPHVAIDEKEAARLICNHLISLGHKNYAYCFEKNPNSLVRFHLCAEVLQSHHLPPPALYRSFSDLDQGLENKAVQPTALICYSDMIAIAVIHHLRHKGFSVPGDISVTGFDDLFFASWPSCQLTTIFQPKTDMGKYAAEMLFRIMEEENVTSLSLPPRLVIRKSTGENRTPVTPFTNQ